MQFEELRGPQPSPRGGPLFASLIHAVAPQAAVRMSKAIQKPPKIAPPTRCA